MMLLHIRVKGILKIILLGRFDNAYATSAMSKFVRRILVYLKTFPKGKIEVTFMLT
jgi:hypothetical protein